MSHASVTTPHRSEVMMAGLDAKPALSEIVRRSGVAGQVSYTVTATYEGEDPSAVTFVGTMDGGPIVMITAGMPDGMFVSDPQRYGKFGAEWVRRFFQH